MINDNLYIYCHYVNDNVCQFHERESRLFGSGGAINPGGDLARPGENVTGLSDFSSDLVTKRLELLKSMDPSISHVAVLLNPANATNPLEFKRMQAVAPKLGVTLVAFEIRSAEEIDRAFEAIRKQRRGAVILAGDALWNVHRERILALAAKHRLPALYPSWSALIAPARTPTGLVARINVAVVEALRSTESQKRLADLTIDTIANSPSEAAAFIREEKERWGKVIRTAGVKAD